MRLQRVLITATLVSSLMTKNAVSAENALLSIIGIPLDRDNHLMKVSIRTWGVEVLAVCRFPDSAISVALNIDPGAILTWQASSWHGKPALSTLSALFLVCVHDRSKNAVLRSQHPLDVLVHDF